MKKNKINIKKLILAISFISILLTTPIITSLNVIENNNIGISNNESQINVIIYGSIRLFFSQSLYFGVQNLGDTSAYNVSGTFRVEGTSDNSISFTDTFNFEEIPNRHVTGKWYTKPINGFGKITLTCNAESSNAGSSEVSVNGLLIGYRAFVFGIYI